MRKRHLKKLFATSVFLNLDNRLHCLSFGTLDIVLVISPHRIIGIDKKHFVGFFGNGGPFEVIY